MLIAPLSPLAPSFERVFQFPVPGRPDLVEIGIVVKLL
jgi:hypothetical protein